MDELIDVLQWIHKDLIVIGVVLLCILLFKDCHGYGNESIVNELKNIKSAISTKQMWKKD